MYFKIIVSFQTASKHSARVDRMKNYLREAGFLFVPYKKISEQCNGNDKKIADKLLEMLHEKGLKGL